MLGLFNRSLIVSLILLVIQQAIAASSTVFIKNLFVGIERNESVGKDLLFLLVSITLPTLFWMVSRVYLSRSAQEGIEHILQKYGEIIKGKISRWKDEDALKERHVFLQREAITVVRDFYEYLHDFSQTTLNILLNITVLVVVVDVAFVWAYLAAIVLTVISLKLTNNKIEQASDVAQNQRLELDRFLQNSWDNLIIGNKFNQTVWTEEMTAKMLEVKGKEVSLQKKQEVASSTSSLLAQLPLFLTVGLIWHFNKTNFEVLAVLFATLPRQMAVLNNFHVINYYVTSGTELKTRLAGLKKMLSPVESIDLKSRISFKEISAESSDEVVSPQSLEEYESKLKSMKSGRVTLRGPNGAGKSTMLILLKEKLGDEGFFLPTSHSLIFEREAKGRSTGQAVLYALQYLENGLERFLLLDEWDANLDAKNIRLIDEQINKMAEKRVIIEVRHRT